MSDRSNDNKIEALRAIKKTEIGNVANIEETEKKDNIIYMNKADEKKEEYTDLDLEIDMCMYKLQCYPCLRYNIKSYIPLLKKKVIGQDKTLEKLIYIAYYNQYVNFLAEYTEDESYKRKSMLLIAPTGCGKSTMLRALEKAFNVPVYRANITATTSAGYVGDKVESMLLGLIEKANGDVASAERGILLIDEIDKKITSTSNDRDVAGKAVQQEILKLFDKGTINLPGDANGISKNKTKFDTGKLTIIMAGACVGLDEIRKKRLKTKTGIGFGVEEKEEISSSEYTSNDLIEYGFIPELVGRINIIEELEEYNVQKLVDIIYFSDESSMQEHVRILNSLGVDEIKIDATLWEKISMLILSNKLGVRELDNIIGKLFYPIVYEAFQHNTSGSCTIDEDGVYTLTYPKEKKSYTGKSIEFKEEFEF